MKKKLLSLILAGAMVMAMAGCGNTEPTTPGNTGSTGTAAAGSVAVPGESSFEHIAKIFPEAFRKVIAVISAGAESMLPVPAGLENKAAVAAVTAVGGVILPGIPDLVHEFFLKVLRKRGTVSGGQAAMAEDLGFPGAGILKAFGGSAG